MRPDAWRNTLPVPIQWSDPVETFSLRQLADLSGLAYATVADWLDDGILEPCEVRAGRCYQLRRYSRQAAFATCAVASLQRNGVPIPALATAFRFIVKADQFDFSSRVRRVSASFSFGSSCSAARYCSAACARFPCAS